MLAQEKADEKSNEITAIPALLDILVVAGCLVTIDAMGCQRSIAEKIAEAQGRLPAICKRQPGSSVDDITEAFAHGKTEDEYTEKAVGHGRIESRTTRVITDISWICNQADCKKLGCMIMVFATRYNKQERKSNLYAITSAAKKPVQNTFMKPCAHTGA